MGGGWSKRRYVRVNPPDAGPKDEKPGLLNVVWPLPSARRSFRRRSDGVNPRDAELFSAPESVGKSRNSCSPFVTGTPCYPHVSTLQETKSDGTGSGSGSGRFERTQWTMILKARDEGAADAQDAMESFARIYWPPLYRFIRREGYNRHDAQDLTQEFYCHFREKHLLDRVTERNGKFRNFLLTCLKNFLSDQRDRAGALKRGGGQTFIALDALEAEERDAVGPIDGLTAEQIYERRWWQAIVDQATSRLRGEYAKRNKLKLFELLKDLQPGEHGEKSHAETGAELGMTEQAVKNARHAFNRRYGQLLHEVIAQTVADPGEVEAEIQHLMRIFAR